MNAEDLKKARRLSQQVSALGGKPVKSPIRLTFNETPVPTDDAIRAIVAPMVKQHIAEIPKPEMEITSDLAKAIVQAIHALPELDKLEVSKGIRNAASFIYGGTKYGMHEMMHGGASASNGLTIITITGTVDDSNVTFTATTQPTLLNINGAFYQNTGGAITWTYVAGTITLSIPVGTGGQIYGL